MKFLLNISLFMIVLIQFCIASEDAFKDKRYPVYDLISTKIGEYLTIEQLQSGRMNIDLWSQYNDAVETNNQTEIFKTDEYTEISKAVEEVYKTVKLLEEDKLNCDLRNALKVNLMKVTFPNDVDKFVKVSVYKTQISQRQKSLPKIFRTTLDEIDKELPAAIGQFIGSLDDKERETYKELVETCEQYLLAKDNVEKLYYLPKILSLYKSDSEIKGAHCKWNAFLFREFEMTLQYFSMRAIPHLYREYERMRSAY